LQQQNASVYRLVRSISLFTLLPHSQLQPSAGMAKRSCKIIKWPNTGLLNYSNICRSR